MPSSILPSSSAQAIQGPRGTDRPRQGFFTRWDAVVLLGSALYLLLFFPHPWFTGDAGYVAAGAERVARGQVPYRDFFSELGPGTYYLQALVFKLLGVGLTAVNVVVWLTGLGLSWLIYRLGKLVIDGPAAVLPSFIFVSIYYPLCYCLSHHWIGNFFYLLTLLLVAENVRRGEAGDRRAGGAWWFVAGIASVATLVSMQPMGVVAFILVPAYLLLAEKTCRRQKWREAVQTVSRKGGGFLAGFGVAFAAVAFFFSGNHAAKDWLYDNFLFLITNYWPFVNQNGTLWYALSHPLHLSLVHPSISLSIKVLGYYVFMAVGPMAVLAGSAWCVRALRDSENVRARLILLYLLGNFGVFLAELHSVDLLHFVLGGVLLVPLLLSIYQILFQRKPRARKLLVTAGVLAGALVIAGSAWYVGVAKERSTPVTTRRGTFYATSVDAVPLSEWVAIIQNRVPVGGETLIFTDHPSLYFLTDTRNPTRFDNLIPVFHSSAQIEEVADSLVRRRPRFIFDTSREDAPTEPVVVVPHPLETFLRSAQSPYHPEQEIDSMTIWALGK